MFPRFSFAAGFLLAQGLLSSPCQPILLVVTPLEAGHVTMGPYTYNPPLTMGSIESSEFFTRWRPVIMIAQFHDLAFVEEARHLGGLMNLCRERNVPNLSRQEEEAIFTCTKFLNTHQLNFTISGMETEILFQIEQTWGVIISPEDIKLTIPDPVRYQILLPDDMTVREALEQYRPNWHCEQDHGNHRRPFQTRAQPYVFRMNCQCNAPDIFIPEPYVGYP